MAFVNYSHLPSIFKIRIKEQSCVEHLHVFEYSVSLNRGRWLRVRFLKLAPPITLESTICVLASSLVEWMSFWARRNHTTCIMIDLMFFSRQNMEPLLEQMLSRKGHKKESDIRDSWQPYTYMHVAMAMALCIRVETLNVSDLC